MATLQRDSSGPDVTALQQRLKDLGFDPNGIDGKFGPGTQAAVMAFQKANGLQVDGVVGPNTRAALQLDGAATPAAGSSAGSAGAGVPDAGGLNLTGLTGQVPNSVIAQIPEA